MSRSARFFQRLVAAAIAAGAGACLSPTLPLPPPEEPSLVSAGTDGTWQVGGTCLSGAQVVVVNQATGRGEVYVDRDSVGRYSVTIEGQACDVIVLSQRLGDESSGETRFVLEETVDGIPVDPSSCAP